MNNKKIYYWVDQDKLRIEMNTSDSTEWKQLKGIGPKLSNRIISYRKKLGGFNHKEQLKEVWGLPLETYEQIHPKLYIGKPLDKRKISTHKEAFIQHPYLPYKVRGKLNNYLSQAGSSIDSLSLSALPFLSDTSLEKLSNYFWFE